MDNNYLTHHGVLGMRWGVRRSKAQLNRAAGRRSKKDVVDNEHDDYKKAHSKKSYKTMSDQELRNRINRLQMEKQYRDLSKRDVSAGRQFVTGLLKESGKDIAKSYITKYGKKAIEKGIESLIKSKLGKGV